MSPRSRKKLVAFFEVRDAAGGVLKEPTPWAEHLAELAKEKLADRMHPIHNIAHWGRVYPYNGVDHLVLARKRDNMSSFNTDTEEFLDIESDSGRPWVEISVIHFLPGTNRLGFVLGSNASPHISTLASWINLHGIFAEPITIEPVIATDTLRKLRGAAEATFLKVKYTSDQISAMRASSGLYSASRALHGEVGDISVEMVLRIEGGIRGSKREHRSRMLNLIKSVIGGGDMTKAAAKLINYDAEGHVHGEEVDFIRHRLAKRMDVALTDRDGNPVKISSAIEAIHKAAKAFERDLYQDPVSVLG